MLRTLKLLEQGKTTWDSIIGNNKKVIYGQINHGIILCIKILLNFRMEQFYISRACAHIFVSITWYQK